MQRPGRFHIQDAEEDEGTALNVDWRAYSQTHSLTDKQQKLAEKVRKRENRIAALQREVDKIRVRSLPPCTLPPGSWEGCKPLVRLMSSGFWALTLHLAFSAAAPALGITVHLLGMAGSDTYSVKHQVNAAKVIGQERSCYGCCEGGRGMQRRQQWLQADSTQPALQVKTH